MGIGNIILESTTSLNSTDVEILQEEISSSPEGQPVNKVIFKSVLQTAEEDNQNGRFYKREILQSIVKSLNPKAKSRSLFQEIDHPFVSAPSSDPMIMKKRAVVVQLKNCGSLIRNMYLDGNNVIGEIETLSGFKGPDLYNTIVNDKANIGFSVRMFGRVVKDPSTGRNYVEQPIRPITYDVVTNPSHVGATILEFLPEDISNIIELQKARSEYIIEESSCLSCDNVNLEECITDTLDYLNTLLEESYYNTRIVRFKF